MLGWEEVHCQTSKFEIDRQLCPSALQPHENMHSLEPSSAWGCAEQAVSRVGSYAAEGKLEHDGIRVHSRNQESLSWLHDTIDPAAPCPNRFPPPLDPVMNSICGKVPCHTLATKLQMHSSIRPSKSLKKMQKKYKDRNLANAYAYVHMYICNVMSCHVMQWYVSIYLSIYLAI